MENMQMRQEPLLVKCYCLAVWPVWSPDLSYKYGPHLQNTLHISDTNKFQNGLVLRREKNKSTFCWPNKLSVLRPKTRPYVVLVNWSM